MKELEKGKMRVRLKNKNKKGRENAKSVAVVVYSVGEQRKQRPEWLSKYNVTMTPE